MKEFAVFQIWTLGLEMGGVLLTHTEIQIPRGSKSPECVLNFKDLSNLTGFVGKRTKTVCQKKKKLNSYVWYSEHLDCMETNFSKTNFAKWVDRTVQGCEANPGNLIYKHPLSSCTGLQGQEYLGRAVNRGFQD